MDRDGSMLEALRTQSQPVTRSFVWKYVLAMTNAAIALSFAEIPGALKNAVAESRTFLFGYDSIESSNSLRAVSAAARLMRADGGFDARRVVSRCASVVIPPDSRPAFVRAVSCGSFVARLVSAGLPPALFPPLQTTHAPPAPSRTTTPTAMGTNERFLTGAA